MGWFAELAADVNDDLPTTVSASRDQARDEHESKEASLTEEEMISMHGNSWNVHWQRGVSGMMISMKSHRQRKEKTHVTRWNLGRQRRRRTHVKPSIRVGSARVAGHFRSDPGCTPENGWCKCGGYFQEEERRNQIHSILLARALQVGIKNCTCGIVFVAHDAGRYS